MSDKQLSYWDKRSVAIEENINKKSNKAIKEMELAYKSAMIKLQREIEVWYSKLAYNNKITYQEALKLLNDDELEEFKWTVEQYINNGMNNYSKEMLQKLKNASARVHIKKLDALKLIIDTELDGLSTYKQSFLDKLLKKTTDYTFSETIKQITGKIQRMDRYKISELLKRPWTPDNVSFSKRIWRNQKLLSQKLHRHLSESIITGRHVKEAVLKISKEMRVDLNRAKALVYTESSALSARAKLEAYKELGVTKYKIVAVMDYKTSPTCTIMNEKIFDITEYRIGETAPPFHVNCRTTTSPVLDDWEEEEEQEQDDEKEVNENGDDDLQNKEEDSIIEVEDTVNNWYYEMKVTDVPDDFKNDADIYNIEQGKEDFNKYLIQNEKAIGYLEDYTAEGSDAYYKLIKKHLNDIRIEEREIPRVKELIEGLDKITTSIPTNQSFVTYRGLNNTEYAEKLLNLKKGTEIIADHSFMSTSIDFNVAVGFTGTETANEFVYNGGTIMRILIKKGQKVGAYIAEHSEFENEAEFLLARNLKVKLIDCKKRKFKMGDQLFENYVVDLEVIE